MEQHVARPLDLGQGAVRELDMSERRRARAPPWDQREAVEMVALRARVLAAAIAARPGFGSGGGRVG